MILEKILEYKKLFFIAIILAVLLPYSNIFDNQFAYDDNDFFINWETVKSLSNLPALISGDLPLSHQHVYRPARSIIQAVVYQLFGQNTIGYHLFSLIIYILIILVIYLIAKKLFNRQIAFFTAMIFAVLPVHVEAITFITASFDAWGVLLMLGAFYLYLKENKKFFYFSLLLSLLAFFTYEFTLILPFLIVCYEICFKNLKIKIIGWSKKVWWYFGLAVFYFLIRTMVLAKIGSMSFLTDLSFKTRILTATKAFVENFQLVVFNFPLNVNHSMLPANSVWEAQVLLSLVIVIILIISAVVFYRKNLRVYTFIISWFLIGLLPIVNVVRVSRFVAERYLFLSSLAWAMLLGIIFYRSLLYVKNNDYKILRGLVAIIFLALVIFYGAMTFNRNNDWQSDESLWQSTLADEKNDTRSYNNLAFAARQNGDFNQAIEYLNKAIEIDPNYYLAYENLGEIYSESGQQEKAIENFNRVIELKSNYFIAYHNRGFAYYLLNQKESAKNDYLKALELDPDYYQANLNLGAIYLEENNFEKAIFYFEKALKINNSNGEIYEALGMAYLGANKTSLAKDAFTNALRINPNSSRARQFLDKLK